MTELRTYLESLSYEGRVALAVMGVLFWLSAGTLYLTHLRRISGWDELSPLTGRERGPDMLGLSFLLVIWPLIVAVEILIFPFIFYKAIRRLDAQAKERERIQWTSDAQSVIEHLRSECERVSKERLEAVNSKHAQLIDLQNKSQARIDELTNALRKLVQQPRGVDPALENALEVLRKREQAAYPAVVSGQIGVSSNWIS